MTDGARPIPLLGDIPLDAIQHIEHGLNAGFASIPIAGLDGELQQRIARGSHRIALSGTLFGDGAADALATLQHAAADGTELAFSADITTALDLQLVVLEDFRAIEQGGRPGSWTYELVLVESPPLPAPAEVSSFGGLGDFGLGDLGVDPGVLDDISSAAGEIAGAVDTALNVVGQLSSLADLGSLGGLLAPLDKPAAGVDKAGEGLAGTANDAAAKLG